MQLPRRLGPWPQDNFHQFEVARMNLAPKKIVAHIMPSAYDVPMGGAGEPGVPVIAPAPPA